MCFLRPGLFIRKYTIMSGNGKIIVNKHYDVASAITAGAFTTLSSATNDYKKGEIIVSNEPENEGLYIMNALGQVVQASAKIDYELIRTMIETAISKAINHRYLTETEYSNLVASGKIDENCTYFVYEGSVKPEPGAAVSGDTLIANGIVEDGIAVITNAEVIDGVLVFKNTYTPETGGTVEVSGDTVVLSHFDYDPEDGIVTVKDAEVIDGVLTIKTGGHGENPLPVVDGDTLVLPSGSLGPDGTMTLQNNIILI